jgi:adenylate cyclase
MLFFVMVVFPSYSIILPVVSMMLITIFSYLGATLYIYFIRERKSRRLKMAFGSYVSPDVVNQIAKDSSLMKLHGQKQNLTVLFSDIRGFTSYSEALEPEEVVRVLNEYLSAMSEQIFKFKGTIDKFMGDGIMSIFGAPIAQKDHANRACHAALSMRQGLVSLNLNGTSLARGFEMGIGINTGLMTVGNIGSKRKFDYTVIGDNVNLGSRLEGLTKLLGVDILVSQATMEEVEQDRFVFRELIPVVVKGKERPVLIHHLMGYKGDQHISMEALSLWNQAKVAYSNKLPKDCINALTGLRQYWPQDVTANILMQWCLKALQANEYQEVWSPDQK